MNENNKPYRSDWKSRLEWPDHILRSKVLKKREMLVLLAIARHWPNMRPSYDRLAEECNVSRQTVKRAIAVLKQYGIIKIIEKGGYNRRTNVYMVYDTPEIWAAKTPEELKEACWLAQQQYESDKIIEFAKKESPASVGADADESAMVKNNDSFDNCTTVSPVCQSDIEILLPWASKSDCEKLINEAKKAMPEDEIVGYLRFCAEKMQAEEEKGKIIRVKMAYLIAVIKQMPEQYRQNKQNKPSAMAPTKPAQEYEGVDANRFFEDDADWLYDISNPDESQKNDT